MPARKGLKHALELVFRAFDFRQGVMGPVLVNLTTAFFLFLAVVVFKDPIYKVLRPSSKVEQFPIYCVAEGYATKGGPLLAEVYIINRRGQDFSHDELVRFLKANVPSEEGKSKDAGQTDPSIRIQW